MKLTADGLVVDTRAELATLRQRQHHVRDTLAKLERQIWGFEGGYLRATQAYGNVVRGWAAGDGEQPLTATPHTTPTDNSPPSGSKVSVNSQHRVFSHSSVTSEAAVFGGEAGTSKDAEQESTEIKTKEKSKQSSQISTSIKTKDKQQSSKETKRKSGKQQAELKDNIKPSVIGETETAVVNAKQTKSGELKTTGNKRKTEETKREAVSSPKRSKTVAGKNLSKVFAGEKQEGPKLEQKGISEANIPQVEQDQEKTAALDFQASFVKAVIAKAKARGKRGGGRGGKSSMAKHRTPVPKVYSDDEIGDDEVDKKNVTAAKSSRGGKSGGRGIGKKRRRKARKYY